MEKRIPKIIEIELNAKVLDIERISEGYSHHMYEVKIDRNPFEVIVRFSNNIKENHNLGKEKYIIDLLRKNKISAPKILAFYFPEEKKEEGYMILEKIKGKRLDTIWDSLTKKEKLKITEKIGKLAKQIHSIKLEEFGYIQEQGRINSDTAFKFRQVGKKLEYSKFLRELLKSVLIDLSRLMSYKIIDPKFISKFVLYLSSNLEKFDYKGEPTLNHGDFMTGHLFVEKINGDYEITGIIDFEFSISSSPEYDFIKLHRQNFFKDEQLKQALEKGYGKINEEAVEILRLTRDIGFAWAMLESGNKKLSEETLQKIERKIDKKLS